MSQKTKRIWPPQNISESFSTAAIKILEEIPPTDLNSEPDLVIKDLTIEILCGGNISAGAKSERDLVAGGGRAAKLLYDDSNVSDDVSQIQ